MKRNYLWILLSCLLTTHARANNDICGGPSALLNIINRPTVADSACTVPFGKSVLEMGYQSVQPKIPIGTVQDYPESVFRMGVSPKSEVVAVLPNYIKLSRPLNSGFTATTVGIKHEFASNTNWLLTGEVLFTPPSGSDSLGSRGLGTAVNGILAYNVSDDFSLSFMFGATSLTEPVLLGGQRYLSVNPDLILTYSATPKLNLYSEIYGQSKTSSTTGSGFNFDAGLLYLVFPNVVFDIEYGHEISGNLGIFKEYVGAGISALF